MTNEDNDKDVFYKYLKLSDLIVLLSKKKYFNHFTPKEMLCSIKNFVIKDCIV